MRGRRRSDAGILEGILGGIMDLLPVICAVLIVIMAGRAYKEGYGLFVTSGLDKPGEGHMENVTITEEDAGSAWKVGRLLEKQDLVGNGLFFALKAKLSGADDQIRPGSYMISSSMSADEILATISVDPTAPAEGEEKEETSADQEGGSKKDVKENKDVWGQ